MLLDVGSCNARLLWVFPLLGLGVAGSVTLLSTEGGSRQVGSLGIIPLREAVLCWLTPWTGCCTYFVYLGATVAGWVSCSVGDAIACCSRTFLLTAAKVSLLETVMCVPF